MKFQSALRNLLLGVLVLCMDLHAAAPVVTVYKTAACGCCNLWVQHLKANGFTVAVKDVLSTAEYVHRYGVPGRLQACHTAVVGGYVIEGHVPAEDIQKLLKTHPKARGLVVPGMPVGSPGMEQGSNRQAFSVLLIGPDGKTSEFHRYTEK